MVVNASLNQPAAARALDADSQVAGGELSHRSSDTHIDVSGAEQQFQHLARQLSHASREHATDSADPGNEKQDENDEFDLVAWLQNINTEAAQAGIKRKRVHVIWRGLTVRAAATLNMNIRTFSDAVVQTMGWPIFKIAQLAGAFDMGSRNLLEDFTGHLRAGEMCLVLGRPGAGCSTFLKTIANQRGGYHGVDGAVTYNSLDADTFKKRFRGEALYCEEDENHFPTLTVGQTIAFALSLKQPGKLPPGTDKAQFREEVLDTLLKMFNVSHTRDTLVGNPHVRGVSGGERKRVSIIEALASRMAVGCWDNSTRGLDASTALDYAKSLRILTDLLETTTFVTLYQAGEGIWEQFDKVLLIDEGRCIYFGPRAAARQYFVNLGFADLPRQTSADYITGCTDPNNQRRFAEGRDATNVPSNPEQLETAYKNSSIYRDMMEQQEQLEIQTRKDRAIEDEFLQAVREDKNHGVRGHSPYTVSFFAQVYQLTKRQMWITLGNPFDIFMSLFTAIVVALVIGSLFYKLPATAAGAFTRGGVLFVSLLFNSFTAFSELPTQMGNRVILYKHQGFAFFRPAAMPLAQLLADIPFSFVRVFCFSMVIWFMSFYTAHNASGSSSSDMAGNYFFFFITVYMTFLAMCALFRIFGTICKDYNMAARLAAVIISALVVFAGYIIPRDGMARWLFWISYLNPFYFGFSALMINEFKSLDLACIDSYVTPRGAGYPTGVSSNQVCTLAGSIAGQQSVAGIDYLEASFGYGSGVMGLNFAVVVIFFVGLAAITSILIEMMSHGSFASSLVITKKPNKEEQELNARLQERKAAKLSADTESQADADVPQMLGKPMTWRNLSYTVPVKGGKRQLLNSVDGFCEPGSLTALMGSSGAGKTTLLDVLADRKSVGVIEGDRLCNGREIDISFQRGCGYAEQQDIHEPTATVREALRFSAYLRQPPAVPIEEKNAYVEEIIELLEMEDIADAVIGYPEFGLGVGDRKKVTIGVELAAKPDLLLFLDEPTSGLDGQSAYNIVRFLRKLAAGGQAIVCTIHQPNSLLFELFDRLLLLQRGGEVVYFGPIGKDSQHVVNYFAQHGASMDPKANPAEAMLEIIGAGSSKRVGNKDWAEVYLESQLYQDNLRKIEEIREKTTLDAQAPDASGQPKGTEYATSFAFQFKEVLKRTLRSSWRQPDYQFTRLFQHACIALIAGLVFLQLGLSSAAVQYKVFDIFMLAVVPALILAQLEPMYIMARSVFMREDSSKYYSAEVFALAQVVSEVPYALACALVFFVLNYYMVFVNLSNEGTSYSSSEAGYFFAMTLLVEIFSTTLGQAIAALSPSVYIASLANPFALLFFSLLCGVTIPKPNMQAFYADWLYYLNPITWMISGLTINQLHGLPVRCTASEYAVFSPPSGQTCAAYAGSFLSTYGGYLANPEATTDCQYCSYASGDDFLATLGLDPKDRARDIGIFTCYIFSNLVILLAAQKFLKYANR